MHRRLAVSGIPLNFIKNSTEKIQSLQALRAVAFIGIFLMHVRCPVSWSNLSVSIFFVLSGFLMVRKYADDFENVSFKQSVLYAIHKIKGLYPLHIITMICCFVLSFMKIVIMKGIFRDYMILFIKVILHTCLLQAWIPVENICNSLNGVSWFLSAILFAYFAFPFLVSIIRKVKKKIFICALFIFGIQFFAPFFMAKFFSVESEVFLWLTYFSPIFRIFDFAQGCILGFLLTETNKICFPVGISTIIESAVLILTICLYIFIPNQIHSPAFNSTTLYVPLAFLWVAIFYLNYGYLSKIITNKYMIWMGNLSGYMFLIHLVIIKYLNVFMQYMGNITGVFRGLIIILEFGITIFFAVLYSKKREKKR